MSLKIDQKEENGKIEILFQGQVDEDSDFSNLQVQEGSYLIINWGEVSSINSCGIREWIRWCKTLPGIEKMEFHKCPKVIVDQMNIVDGFIPQGAVVESFYVPYYNEDKDSVVLKLFEKGVDFDDGKVNPPEVIEVEDGEAEIDVVEQKYFKFLK